jgi:hypothetical protein
MWIAATRVGNSDGPRGPPERDDSADMSVLASESLVAILLKISRADK